MQKQIDVLAESIVPDALTSEQYWTKATRSFVAEVLKGLSRQEQKVTAQRVHYYLATATDVELCELLGDDAAAKFISPDMTKALTSIRSVAQSSFANWQDSIFRGVASASLSEALAP